MINPLTWFVTLREKLLALTALVFICLGIGWHLHTVWDDYLDTISIKSQLARAQEVPAKLIDFNHKLKASNVQANPCYNTKLPADLLRILR
jgi:hypothetical protein